MTFDEKFLEQLRQEQKRLAQNDHTEPRQLIGGVYRLHKVEELIQWLAKNGHDQPFPSYPVEVEGQGWQIWGAPAMELPPKGNNTKVEEPPKNAYSDWWVRNRGLGEDWSVRTQDKIRLEGICQDSREWWENTTASLDLSKEEKKLYGFEGHEQFENVNHAFVTEDGKAVSIHARDKRDKNILLAHMADGWKILIIRGDSVGLWFEESTEAYESPQGALDNSTPPIIDWGVQKE